MHIAPLGAANAADYRALMLHAYEQAADAFTSTAEERTAEPDGWWIDRIAHPDGSTLAFGAFDDAAALTGAVALAFSTKPKTRHKVQLVGMFVRAACRGRGIGRALLQAAARCAEARAGVEVMTLTVTEGNAAAIRLYRDHGFEAFGTEPMAILTPTGYRAKVHMWRPVRAGGPPPDASAGPALRPASVPDVPGHAVQRLTVADAGDWAEFAVLPAMQKFTSTAYSSASDLIPGIERSLSDDANAPVLFAVREPTANALVATFGFHTVSALNRTAEVTYGVRPERAGRGLATAICAAAVRWGFADRGWVRVQATVFEPHLASQRVLRKCGFEFEGRLRNFRIVRGKPRDYLLFATVAAKTPQSPVDGGS